MWSVDLMVEYPTEIDNIVRRLMKGRLSALVIALAFILMPAARAASRVEKIKNQKVVVYEVNLAPGESDDAPSHLPCMVVFMAPGMVKSIAGHDATAKVREGQTIYFAAHAESIVNAGSSPLHYARIDFLTSGLNETWGMKGLSPNYKMLIENQYARAYDIRIPPQTFEPQHTHHDRVVVSLSGATLEHILPNGEKQPSTLKTGEIVWRLAATHVGHNMGHTNLWVIAIEPK